MLYTAIGCAQRYDIAGRRARGFYPIEQIPCQDKLALKSGRRFLVGPQDAPAARVQRGHKRISL